MSEAPDDRPAWPCIRVADAVVHHPETGDLALVRNMGTWWLPGGRVEPGESFADAARREVAEETGLAVEVTGVLAVSERVEAARHIVFVTCATLVVGGTLSPPEGDPKIDAVQWVSLDEASRLLPEFPVTRVVLDPPSPVPCLGEQSR